MNQQGTHLTFVPRISKTSDWMSMSVILLMWPFLTCQSKETMKFILIACQHDWVISTGFHWHRDTGIHSLLGECNSATSAGYSVNVSSEHFFFVQNSPCGYLVKFSTYCKKQITPNKSSGMHVKTVRYIIILKYIILQYSQLSWTANLFQRLK